MRHHMSIVNEWFLESHSEFLFLMCPAQSQNLDPIKHLWDEIEKK